MGSMHAGIIHLASWNIWPGHWLASSAYIAVPEPKQTGCGSQEHVYAKSSAVELFQWCPACCPPHHPLLANWLPQSNADAVSTEL